MIAVGRKYVHIMYCDRIANCAVVLQSVFMETRHDATNVMEMSFVNLDKSLIIQCVQLWETNLTMDFVLIALLTYFQTMSEH